MGNAVGDAVGGLLIGSPFHIFDHAAAGKDKFVLGLRDKRYVFILSHVTDSCQRDMDRDIKAASPLPSATTCLQ